MPQTQSGGSSLVSSFQWAFEADEMLLFFQGKVCQPHFCRRVPPLKFYPVHHRQFPTFPIYFFSRIGRAFPSPRPPDFSGRAGELRTNRFPSLFLPLVIASTRTMGPFSPTIPPKKLRQSHPFFLLSLDLFVTSKNPLSSLSVSQQEEGYGTVTASLETVSFPSKVFF